MTRERIATLKRQLSQSSPESADAVEPAPKSAPVSASLRAIEQGQEAGPPGADAVASSLAGRGMRHQQTNQRLHVEFDGQDFQLVVSVAPAQEGHLYVRPLAGGPRRLAPASALKLRGFVGR